MAFTGEAVLERASTKERGSCSSGTLKAHLPEAIVALSGLIYLARGWERLRSPQMYAEDGEIFLSQAHNLGLDAFLQPYAGYLHAVPRLVAALTESVPLTAIPAVYALIGVGCYLVTAGVVLSPCLDWLLPSPVSRAATFGLLCVFVPMAQSYGNLANLVAVSGLALFLLSLASDPGRRFNRLAEVCATLLAGLSGPFSFFSAPLFWWRWQRCGRSRHSLILASVVSVAGIIEVGFAAVSDRQVWPGGLEVFGRIWVERLAGGWLFGEWEMFTRYPGVLPTAVALLWLVQATTVILVALRSSGFVLLLYVSILIGVATRAYGTRFTVTAADLDRQLVVPTAVFVVALAASVVHSRRLLPRGIALACLAVGAGALFTRLFPAAYPLPSDMAALERCHERVCSISIFNPGWHVTLIRQGSR